MNLLKRCAVYWIRLPEHTDIRTQGYVGVSKCPERRWNQHLKSSKSDKRHINHLYHAINKYSWHNLVKEVVLFGEESFCYEVELDLRPISNIGWNIKLGGNKIPLKTDNPEYWLTREKSSEQQYLEWTQSEEYQELEFQHNFFQQKEKQKKEWLDDLEIRAREQYLRFNHVKSIFKWIEEYQDD